jgi:hypothetical protein
MRIMQITCTLSLLCIVSSVSAQQLYVEYEADTLPPDDPVAPWVEFGWNCDFGLGGGLLTIDNLSTNAWALFHRFNPALGTYPEIHVEARIKVPSSNEWPCVVGLYDYRDEGHSPGVIGHLWYLIELYSDRMEFCRGDSDVSPHQHVTFAMHPIPDLATEFHTFGITRIEGNERTFVVSLDGQTIYMLMGEPTDRPMDAVVFGYGRALSVGQSVWDYVRYWSIDPVVTEPATWGHIKKHFD